MNRVREYRLKNGVHATELQILIGIKTQSAYYKKESGSIKFTLEEARLIARRLGVTIEELFFNDELSKNDNRRMQKEAS